MQYLKGPDLWVPSSAVASISVEIVGFRITQIP
jgi:hypothetical protein